ncbi:MAG: tail fiber domain-containing protein [Burkholderiales bacterium]|nr:tail fiber domain-containing protein [Burkholderiales bacterium]
MIAQPSFTHIVRQAQRTTCLSRALALAALLSATATHAQTSCPFDGGDASLAKEGLILSRYALGITGAPLVANTGIPAASAQTVEDSINSPAWGLNITGNTDVNGAPVLTPNDATIISRKIAGFSGAALTNGLALSGPRNTPTAVQNFLLAGCPGTAWVQGGNAFGAPGVIGTTDAQPLTVKSGGATLSLLTAGNNGLRITENTSTTVGSTFGIGVHPLTTFINTVNGSPANRVEANIVGATIGGGGFLDFTGPPAHTNHVGGHFGTVGGGLQNSAFGTAGVVSGGRNNFADGEYASVTGGLGNAALGYSSAIGGGAANQASASGATIGGGSLNVASAGYSFVGGGYLNRATAGNAVVGGGYLNRASAEGSTASGGTENTASGQYSTVSGGANNTADGDYSVAMGRRVKTLGNGSFQFADSSNFDFSSSTVNAFRVRATGGVRFVTEIDGTGATTWSCAAFAGAGWSCSSDRNLKQGLKKLDGKKILAKLAAMPVYQWQPKGQNAHIKHVGPMAQDFMKAFGVGDDDKMIGMQDADGVALAAIQGLNQIVKAKDAKIAALEKANAVMQREMAAIKKRLGM